MVSVLPLGRETSVLGKSCEPRAEKAANLLRSTAMSIAEIVWRELLACALKYRFITFGVSLLGLLSITAIIGIAHFNSDTYGGDDSTKHIHLPISLRRGVKPCNGNTTP